MFGLAFKFPTGRFHATPWGRNVNEADVAWPPEPWRILRALVACYWRKGDKERWSEGDLARLIETLAEELPVFRLPEGAIHSHTRHYMPIQKGKSESKTLVFDAFLHLPDGAEVEMLWHNITLEPDLLDLAKDLASAMGYLGRAESWTEARAITRSDSNPNCVPFRSGITGDLCRVLAPRSASAYQSERARLFKQELDRIQSSSQRVLSDNALRRQVERSFRARGGVDTLPIRLVDALTVDTADLQNCKWDQPPAAYEAIYARHSDANPGVVARRSRRLRTTVSMPNEPTVARYLLTGRPRPRIEHAVKIGEVMRAAALSQFGWRTEEATGRRYPNAPWQVSGRDDHNRPIRDPKHPHAFWLPEDADDDGWIDHVTVFIAGGMNRAIRSRLERITRIWTASQAHKENASAVRTGEWSLALEGFGFPANFDGGSRLLGSSRRWCSITPFLASGYLKKAGYPGEIVRLLRRRGIDTQGVTVGELAEITVADAPRRALNFHRFRSRGRERQRDSSGALLQIEFPVAVRGPLALGYASHFGLGIFGTVD